jgi:arginine repressor
MGRPRIDLNPYKDEISTLFNQYKSTETICQELTRRYSIEISYNTLARRLHEWGLRRLPSRLPSASHEALCDRIKSLVYDNLSDQEILPTLHREGFQIAGITLKRLRQQLGLRRRTDDPEAQRIQENQILEVLRQEIQDGSIEGYGRGLLHTHLRQKGYVFPR